MFFESKIILCQEEPHVIEIIHFVAVSCEVLQDPENGRVTVLGTLPGSVAQYSCNAGFRLVGLKTRVCSQDGSFSGQAPTCKCEFKYNKFVTILYNFL